MAEEEHDAGADDGLHLPPRSGDSEAVAVADAADFLLHLLDVTSAFELRG